MPSTLLAVPNVSEGRDKEVVEEIAVAFDARLLDVHSDSDHNRSVYTLAGAPGQLAHAVCAGAGAVIERIELDHHEGAHPRIGAIDVAPIVYLRDMDRGAACAEALVLADMLGGELELPVFLYGALGQGRTRADLRWGGLEGLSEKLAGGQLIPDFGPTRLHPTAGAALVAARPPLVAFNVELAPPADGERARAIAAKIREGGEEGLQSVRAIGLWLKRRGTAQVSTNIEDHRASSPAMVVEAIARHAPPVKAEVVGLAPKAALAGLPKDLPIEGERTIEDALAALPSNEQAPGSGGDTGKV